MKQVTMREVQVNLSGLLKEPFEITRYGVVVAVVTPVGAVKKKWEKIVSTNMKTVEEAKKVVEPFILDMCKHGAKKGLCRFGC